MHSAVWSVATRGMARVRGAGAALLGAGTACMRGAGAAQLSRPVQRTAHGDAWRRRGSVTALLGEPSAAWHWRTGDDGERRLTGAETAARRDGDGRAASEAVGAKTRSTRRLGRRQRA
jgi:hypothetical protein